MDSRDFLEFLFALEDRLKISIPQAAVAHVKTLRELAKAIDGVNRRYAADGSADVPNVARDASINAVMSNSFGCGGMNAVLVARRPAKGA